eukprot:CAMPEP_0116101866 /NCGR_PEP_ID=MMETSP0327-20121206/13039_1 /TAXON_ID=44447 /ORGANISM="Pseudo-nitzschia delicatissima, Strain B596" /LENGTH=428 /DNA_ID=CAMNT_0003593857 /DNA_START=36 /DNA_END=1322 /DNA_ORIENTATION=+
MAYHGDWLRMLSQEPPLEGLTASIEEIHHEYTPLYNPVLMQGQISKSESEFNQRLAIAMLAYRQEEARRSRIEFLADYCSTSSPPASLTQQYEQNAHRAFHPQPETIPSWGTSSALLIARSKSLPGVISPLPTRLSQPTQAAKKRSLLDAMNYGAVKLMNESSTKLPRLEHRPFQRNFPSPTEVLTRKPAAQDTSNHVINEEASSYLDLSTKKPDGLRHQQWEAQFKRLVNYKKVHGDTLVPTNYPSDPQLGNWVRNQRLANKNKNMTEERKSKLDGIGFFWYFYDRSTTRWEEMFLRLVDYKEAYGDTNVPLRYPKDQQLGAWVNYQRTTRRQGKLSATKIAKLNSVEFEWNPMKHAATWEHMFWRLLAYKNCFGHTKVPFRYKPDPSLGYWVSNQRAFYRKRKLSPDRTILLESIGFFPKARIKTK